MKKNTKIFNLRYNLALFSLISSYSIGITVISYEFFDNDKNINVNSYSYIYDFFTPIDIPCQTYSAVDNYISLDNTLCRPYSNYMQELEIINQDVYSGMALSHDFENEIKIIADKYDVPYQIVLAIGERESAGNWNNNGVISCTNDYGEFQINECNLNYIEENLGYTKEEVLYNSSKNAEACIFLLDDIIDRDDVITLEDVFGMYNGWVNWEEKPQSVEYVDACSEIMDDYFPDYQYSLKKN